MRPVVCHLSFNHGPFDDRIYWKELVSLNNAGYQAVHISVGTADADYLSGEGIRMIVVRRRKKSRLALVNRMIQVVVWKGTTLESVFEAARSVNARIYHYHDLQLNALTRKLKTLPQKPKVVYDAHEAYHLLMRESLSQNPVHQSGQRLLIRIASIWERQAAARCDHIFVTDPYSYNYFSRVAPGTPVSLLHNYSYFFPDTGVTEKSYDLLYTGLMNRSRGTLEILQATCLLKKIFPGIRLLLIGPFETREYEKMIRAFIEENALMENVCVQDPVPFKEMPFIYKNCRIGLGIFHPTPKYSTFIPIKLFEYMAFGLPVVFSNHGPSAAIIRESGTGLLVDPMDPETISTAVAQLMQDPALYSNLSRQAMNAVASRYHWEKEKDKLLSVYEDLVQ